MVGDRKHPLRKEAKPSLGPSIKDVPLSFSFLMILYLPLSTLFTKYRYRPFEGLPLSTPPKRRLSWKVPIGNSKATNRSKIKKLRPLIF